jgi:hypothetical protein
MTEKDAEFYRDEAAKAKESVVDTLLKTHRIPSSFRDNLLDLTADELKVFKRVFESISDSEYEYVLSARERSEKKPQLATVGTYNQETDTWET